jgi:hypothetical protein
MGRTHTIFVNLQGLKSCDHAGTIIRLMMACNDLIVANLCLSQYKTEFLSRQASIRKHVQMGAAMYFVRLQCGHLNEAMKIIKEVKETPYLHDRIERCSQTAKDSFSKLNDCLQGGAGHSDFQKYVGQIRHKTVFHYDNDKVKEALSDRASRSEAAMSKITAGDHMSLCRFELADDILDSIVCRHLWKIPRGADLRQEADRCADFGSDLCRSLVDFAGEFIIRFVKEHAAV